MKTTLVAVVSGAVYEHFADDLFASAEDFFHPTNDVELLMLPGRSGWPAATMYRHHALRDSFPEADYVFLSDADMKFVAPVWNEVLPKQGIVATLHPGYVEEHRDFFPYERNHKSFAYIPAGCGQNYFCGGFIGGTSDAMQKLSESIADIIDNDKRMGITPVWHDESALNKCLYDHAPEKVLTPSFCYPEDDTWYRSIWTRDYDAKLVALDKTEEQRVRRNS